MELKIVRQSKTPTTTIGSLYIDGSKLCDTLEDTNRGLTSTMTLDEIQKIKVQNRTCIPTGRYEIIIDISNRFKKLMPHILDVPGFGGIRIHSGNTSIDTDGCILLGTKIDSETVGSSRDAFAKFFPKLQEGLKQGNVFINII